MSTFRVLPKTMSLSRQHPLNRWVPDYVEQTLGSAHPEVIRVKDKVFLERCRVVDRQPTVFFRSEERRVGKECRSRWSLYHQKKKKKKKERVNKRRKINLTTYVLTKSFSPRSSMTSSLTCHVTFMLGADTTLSAHCLISTCLSHITNLPSR